MSQQGRGPFGPPPPGWGTPPTQQHPQQQQQPPPPPQVPYGHPPTQPMGPMGPGAPPPFHPQAQQQPQAYPPQAGQPGWAQPPMPQQYPAPPGYGQMQPYGYGQQPVIVVQNHVQQPYGMMNPDYKKKDTAVLLCFLAFFVGIHGLHRFYLRDTGLGIVYVLTFGVCGIAQLIDGIKLAMMSQQEFDMKYNMMR